MSEDEIYTEIVAAPEESGTGEARRPVLTVLTGELAGASIWLDRPELVVGRSADCQLVLHGRGISRRHARFSVDGEQVRVQDLKSTNGTWVGSRPIVDHCLAPGERLRLGHEIMLRFDWLDPLEHKVAEELYRGATRDRLTGVVNRGYFLERLQEECDYRARHAAGLVVALLDVDHFKSVNDTWGHPAGDTVLVTLAQFLDETFRNEDLVSRFGGEEFAVLLRGTDLDRGWARLDSVRQQQAATPVTVPTPDGSHALTITFSAGITQWSPALNTPDKLVAAADQALYQAKAQGRNRVVQG